MSSKKGSSSSGGLFRPLAIMGALAGLVYWQLPQLKYLNYWVRAKKLNIEDFAAADFKVNTDIPTTYYEPGEIASVLKEVCASRSIFIRIPCTLKLIHNCILHLTYILHTVGPQIPPLPSKADLQIHL